MNSNRPYEEFDEKMNKIGKYIFFTLFFGFVFGYFSYITYLLFIEKSEKNEFVTLQIDVTNYSDVKYDSCDYKVKSIDVVIHHKIDCEYCKTKKIKI